MEEVKVEEAKTDEAKVEVAAEAAEPQFELFHGLLVAQFLALLLVAAQVFLAVIVIV